MVVFVWSFQNAAIWSQTMRILRKKHVKVPEKRTVVVEFEHKNAERRNHHGHAYR